MNKKILEEVGNDLIRALYAKVYIQYFECIDKLKISLNGFKYKGASRYSENYNTQDHILISSHYAQ